MRRGVQILILAKNSHKKRIDSLIESVQRIRNRYGELLILVYSHLCPTEVGEDVKHIDISTNLRTLWEVEGLDNSCVLIDNIERTDLEFIRYLSRKQVQLVLEVKMLERYQRYLGDVNQNMTYTHIHPEKVAVILPRVIQNLNYTPLANLPLKPKPRVSEVTTMITPKVSGVTNREQADIVIINYNTLNYLEQCINSIKANTSYPYNLIVVDNGSTDGSLRYLRKLKEITLIENRENIGYARACNQGIIAGQGEFVVILNSDIKVTPGWLTGMVNVAKSDPQIGVVGPKMVNENNQIVGAGVVHLDQFCSSRGMGLVDSWDRFMRTEDCYSVGGACYLASRQALEKVGLFDENYFFYYEETDLSLRMIEKGFRVVYTPEAKILHYHEGSFDKRKPQERYVRNQYFEESKQIFARKWGKVINGAKKREHTRDIVIFGIIPWDFRFQRPQQLCSRLAEQGYRILYINNICQVNGELVKKHDNLYVFTPSGVGVAYNNLGFHQLREMVGSIYHVFAKLDILNPILWVDVPYWNDVVEHFERELVIYNCMDSYTDFSDIHKFCPNLDQREEKLCQIADIVLASSKLLQDKLRRYSTDVLCVPNGVDTNHFQSWDAHSLPDDLRHIPKPIIGYYGAIAEWMDLDLIEYIAKRMEDHSFVFIGQPTVDLSQLKRISNIYFLGEKPYNELPRYLHHFKIALIPFKKNRLSLSTNPVKLYEYLAAGKPVVSVDLPEILQFADVVYIAKNYDEFLFLLRQIDDHRLGLERKKRLKAIEGNDWHDRVRIILKAMAHTQSALGDKSLFDKLRAAERRGDYDE